VRVSLVTKIRASTVGLNAALFATFKAGNNTNAAAWGRLYRVSGTEQYTIYYTVEGAVLLPVQSLVSGHPSIFLVG
jgi:hypothetical protein